MIRSLPNSRTYIFSYHLFVVLYFVFLFAPLLVTCILAFNDSQFPSLPWRGFTLDWFLADTPDRLGLFEDSINLRSIITSLETAVCVALLATFVGTCAAFLFEQEHFPGKNILYFLMLAPLVIPGVILGISQLMAATTAYDFFYDIFGVSLTVFQPGFKLVVIGQFSFIATFVTLVVSARLKKFDRTLEDAAMNLGATRLQAILYITIPFLRPAIVTSAAVAFLMSFENFNTTLFLVGSDPTLPINLYLQVRDGSTPVINAVSFLLIMGTSFIAVANLYFSRKAT